MLIVGRLRPLTGFGWIVNGNIPLRKSYVIFEEVSGVVPVENWLILNQRPGRDNSPTSL